MADAAAPWATTISAMSFAFLAGDNADGEELLLAALNLGAPWDVTTAAAAQALGEHRAQTSTSGPCVAVEAISAQHGAGPGTKERPVAIMTGRHRSPKPSAGCPRRMGARGYAVCYALRRGLRRPGEQETRP